jgi:ABC-type multidrug transport system fused ATPase/permease subunit
VSLASLEEVAVLDDRGGDEVLHGISFTAQPGQMVALVGSSGAGKSTIASVLGRLYDVGAAESATFRAADMILVVEDGRIIERGTHDQLLARGGRYAELYDTQFGNQPDPEDVGAA